jgi:hypothetical protein
MYSVFAKCGSTRAGVSVDMNAFDASVMPELSSGHREQRRVQVDSQPLADRTGDRDLSQRVFDRLRDRSVLRSAAVGILEEVDERIAHLTPARRPIARSTMSSMIGTLQMPLVKSWLNAENPTLTLPFWFTSISEASGLGYAFGYGSSR